MGGPFVHDIDPVITQVGPVYLWWYGASYPFGFLFAFWWARRVRAALGLDLAGVWQMVVLLSAGVLLGGRLVEVVELEEHPWFVGCQFHPEFKSRPFKPHPLFVDFIGAAVRQSEGD